MSDTITAVSKLVAAANAKIRTISFDEANGYLANEDAIFVDIRDVRELWRDGKIAGANHSPRGMLEFWVDPTSPYHKPFFAEGKLIIFYCASAWRSALATKAIQDMGLSNVAHLEGGFSAWRKQGGDIEPVESH